MKHCAQFEYSTFVRAEHADKDASQCGNSMMCMPPVMTVTLSCGMGNTQCSFKQVFSKKNVRDCIARLRRVFV